MIKIMTFILILLSSCSHKPHNNSQIKVKKEILENAQKLYQSFSPQQVSHTNDFGSDILQKHLLEEH